MARMQLQRDPFARATLIRWSTPNKYNSACRWCGQTPRTAFSYRWENDGRVEYSDNRVFCSVGCWRAYNG